MPKGKPWTHEEEKQLRDLRTRGYKVSEIALEMGKSEEAIMKKLQRIGLKVVHQEKTNWTTTSTVASEIILPEELFSVEESLGMLAGAMKALKTPGLSKTEVMRLRSLIQAASVYQAKFAEYVDYRGLEKRLLEAERKYEELSKRDCAPDKPVEIKKEATEAQKPAETAKADNPAGVTQEDKNVGEEKGNQNQP